MPTDKEKAAFAKRLKDLLEPLKIRGGTKLAEQFNLRYRGERPVTPQTAHKWLTGTTIPKPDKLRTLAEWLNVKEHWLHYGPPPRFEQPSHSPAARNIRLRRRPLNWPRRLRR